MIVGIRGTKIDRVDASMRVYLVFVMMVEWENVVFVVVVFLLQDVDVHRCRSSSCICRCRNHVVACTCMSPMVTYSVIDVESHSVNE